MSLQLDGDPAGAFSPLRQIRARGRVRGTLALLGPAFVASVAYIDPGNFATNFAAGAQFGYRLTWVILLANLMAMLVQYLSAKLGVATGLNLPELCRLHLGRRWSLGLWAQAELVAMATDLAEFVGAGIALNLLFGVPLFIAGLLTAVVAFVILALEQRNYRNFELAIVALLGIVLLGFRPAGRPRPVTGSSRGHPQLPRHRQRPARRGHHRRHRHAARDLPALRADQTAHRVPRRRRKT